MPRVNLPDKIPGEFFLVAYDRDLEEFSMVIDDEYHSSYKLGDDIPSIMRYFKRVGVSELGNRAIDIAKEFLLVQAVLADGRVLIVKEDPPPLPRVMDSEPSKMVNLPGLSHA